jgi:MFS family permease
MILVGRMLKKVSFKPIYLLGVFLASCSLFLFAFASDFVAFVISQVVLAISYGTLWSAVIFFLSKTTDKSNRGQNTGFLNAAVYLGQVGGNALFASLLLVLPPYTIPITIVAFVPFIAFAIVAFHRFDNLKQSPE